MDHDSSFGLIDSSFHPIIQHLSKQIKNSLQMQSATASIQIAVLVVQSARGNCTTEVSCCELKSP